MGQAGIIVSLSLPPSPLSLTHTYIVKLGAIPATANLPLLLATTNVSAASGVSAISSALATTTASDPASAWHNLLLPKLGPSARERKVWISDGLPAIPNKLYDKTNWEFIDLSDLKPAGTLEALNPDPDPQK